MNVWTSGPEDGRPVLLIHGNLTTGGFWRYVAEQLPDDVRVIAPDMRGFGKTDAEPVTATNGLADMVEDVRSLLEALELTDSRLVAAGWSMGGGVLQQYLLTHPEDLGGLVLIAPLSPYGFGGTKGEDGTLCFPDAAASGAGGANPQFVLRLAAGDRSEDDPQTSPRVVMRTFFGPGANAENVDEEFLLSELLTTRTGEDFYPGSTTPSENWPGAAPGTFGILNTMTPDHYDARGSSRSRRSPRSRGSMAPRTRSSPTGPSSTSPPSARWAPSRAGRVPRSSRPSRWWGRCGRSSPTTRRAADR
jgi:pimeloyl-ACP methyl ester carboxylesterase